MADRVTHEPCPRCHRYTVAYSGNYYCEACPWVMAEDNQPHRIVRSYLAQRWLEAKKVGDKRDMKRLEAYLLGYVE